MICIWRFSFSFSLSRSLLFVTSATTSYLSLSPLLTLCLRSTSEERINDRLVNFFKTSRSTYQEISRWSIAAPRRKERIPVKTRWNSVGENSCTVREDKDQQLSLSFVCNSWWAPRTRRLFLLAVGNRSVDRCVCVSIREKRRARAHARVRATKMQLCSDWYLHTPFPARCHAHLSFDFKEKKTETLHSYAALSSDRSLKCRTRNSSRWFFQECTREHIYWSSVICIFWTIIRSTVSISNRSSRTIVSI